MQISQIPRKFELPFASSAGGSFINFPVPANSQIGITPGAASLTDGFPPLNFSPITSGGVPPRGVDFNGLLFQITGWSQWQSAGGPVYFDSAFQATVGGYPNGAIVQSLIVPGNFWMSTVDNNVTNPDAGGAGWVTPPSMLGTGEWKFRPAAATLPGWVISNGTTIGSVASGASQRANADTQLLYQYLWATYSNTQCPVTGGRGASAAADFAANKPIATFNMQAIGVIGVDGMGGTPTGLLANVPAQSGSATIAGSILGENLHALITAELAVHSHGVIDPGHAHLVSVGINAGGGGAVISETPNAPSANISTQSATTSISIQNAGSGTAHNNVQRSALVYWYHKL